MKDHGDEGPELALERHHLDPQPTVGEEHALLVAGSVVKVPDPEISVVGFRTTDSHNHRGWWWGLCWRCAVGWVAVALLVVLAWSLVERSSLQQDNAQLATEYAKTRTEYAKARAQLATEYAKTRTQLATIMTLRRHKWGTSLGASTCCADPRITFDPLANSPKIAVAPPLLIFFLPIHRVGSATGTNTCFQVLFYGALSPVCVQSQSRLLETLQADAFVYGWLGTGRADRSVPWPGGGNDTSRANQTIAGAFGSRLKGLRARLFDTTTRAELEGEQGDAFAALQASAMLNQHLNDLGGVLPMLGKFKSIEGVNQLKRHQELAQGWRYDYVLLARQDWCPAPDQTLAERIQMMHNRTQIAPNGIYMTACSEVIPEISGVMPHASLGYIGIFPRHDYWSSDNLALCGSSEVADMFGTVYSQIPGRCNPPNATNATICTSSVNMEGPWFEVAATEDVKLGIVTMFGGCVIRGCNSTRGATWPSCLPFLHPTLDFPNGIRTNFEAEVGATCARLDPLRDTLHCRQR
eukprot:TRINITY_DN757_c0_g1_i6.p1 TRINITY_DN757_c0_g1~~TRINITY_DN757_c0_g1_i6.p1  ORF type:complete len:523 (-),score=33.73 TRINITY_DN757_c0_g1_i6:323-1891(-)